MLPSAGWSKAIDAATGYALRWSPEGIVQGIKISPQLTCKWLIGKKWSGFRFDSHHPLQMLTTAASSGGAVFSEACCVAWEVMGAPVSQGPE